MIEVNEEFLKRYTEKNTKHEAYNKTVNIADHLKFHFEGHKKGELDNVFFDTLISTRRPSESEHIRDYRKAIYLPVTKAPCFKVVNSLKKIVKSPDWKIDYSNVEKPSKVRDGENLEDYAEKNYPFFKSIENWFYSYALKEVLADPNGLIAVLPLSYDVKVDEYRKPYSYFIKSDNVYDFREGEYAVFKTDKVAEYYSEDRKTVYKDFIICIVTNTEVWEAKKVSVKGDYLLELKISQGFFPVIRSGGIHEAIIDNSLIYKSFVDPILPGLDAAARESSDLDAEVVQHVFSTMWYFASQGCPTCNGTGKQMKQGKQAICSDCSGNGVIAKSPYKDFVLTPAAIDKQQNPTPPAGYIEKNTEIVKIQDERIDRHIYKALAAINMEFLGQTPLNESGKAKEVDRDELNNFVYGVAYHFVEHILKSVYKYVNDFRVMDSNFTEDVKSKMIPTIAIPERFEILSETYLLDQVVKSRTGNLDPLITSSLEIEYINKKHAENPEIRDKMVSMKQLDPFPTLLPEFKDSGVLAGTINREDAILSNYIVPFVERAIEENPDFFEKSYQEKVVILTVYVKEKMPKQNLINQINAGEEDTGLAQNTRTGNK
jgi:hypothetical protein